MSEFDRISQFMICYHSILGHSMILFQNPMDSSSAFFIKNAIFADATMLHVQCRHLIPALNAWAVRASYTTARPIDTQFHGHGCMNYLKIERRCY